MRSRFPRGELLDRYLATVLVVLSQVEIWVFHVDIEGPRPLVAAMGILVTGSIAFRRRHPLAAFVVVMCATTTIFLVGKVAGGFSLAIAWFCAAYGAAVWTERRGFLTACLTLTALNLLSLLGPHQTMSDIVPWTVVPIVSMLIARRAVRDRQLQAETLAARAELLEREQEMRAHEAVAEERARIARELHDLVAHNVSVMVVQAGAERHALPPEQSSTREALTSIEDAGRQALGEARRLLGMLRRSDGEAEGLEPQPSVDQLDLLVGQVERAGLPVDLTVEGERQPLPAGVDLCAYRVVQEALTNSLKHAGPEARAAVRLTYAPGALDLEVTDDGMGAGSTNGDGAGHGLIGMRERVSLYGGSVETGPRPEGGYAVRARLPLA